MSLWRGAAARVRSAQYVGSFEVEDCSLDEKTWLVHEQMKSLTDCEIKTPVILMLSAKGVKIYDKDKQTLLMAHCLRRISFTTCRSSDRQFAFVAYNPGCPRNELYCHLFVSGQPSEATILNLLLSRMFQLAYIDSHPEHIEQPGNASAVVRFPPSSTLLSEGVSLNVNALVSFRRAPTQGELFHEQMKDDQANDIEDNAIGCSNFMRKKAIRSKVLRSGAYRSFTYDSQTHRSLQEKVCRSWKSMDSQNEKPLHALEAEGNLARCTWSFKGLTREHSTSLLHKDALGSFFLWTKSSIPELWGLSVRTPFGLMAYEIMKNNRNKYMLKHIQDEFTSMEELILYYMDSQGDLLCSLSSCRLNHCFQTEEFIYVSGSRSQLSTEESDQCGESEETLTAPDGSTQDMDKEWERALPGCTPCTGSGLID
ncbi:SH2 domain-containing protein 5 isoform X1 [Polypterus senegalus]|uniref:SH2 domain-containing protein 5 isoform X1 n=1 Tax=Polypterus senegalus TaxID=55291 RepID=UPI0019648770|nr:SH2 domain-containing protein 5 isoform X1 [Polypterus senegalus]